MLKYPSILRTLLEGPNGKNLGRPVQVALSLVMNFSFSGILAGWYNPLPVEHCQNNSSEGCQAFRTHQLAHLDFHEDFVC